MEAYIGQEKIHILTEYSQKVYWEKQLRVLWRTCFGDPQHYEDFYFSKVYANNKVYAMEDRGMIHWNSYLCKVMGRNMVLPYIVGVATNENCRRQGVMRSLLDKVLSDMYEQRVPFTYLMPASEAYYRPFGFQCISEKLESEIKCSEVALAKSVRYLSYQELQKMPAEFRLQLFVAINGWLEERYDIFAIHDESYYDLLYAEKCCQNGDIIFCFNNDINVGDFCGVFAYAMDGEIPYVEQIIAKHQEQLVAGYFTDAYKVKIAISFPYMIRVVHREAFLDLFGETLSRICDFPLEDLTDVQMIDLLFLEKDSVYFAEIV